MAWDQLPLWNEKSPPAKLGDPSVPRREPRTDEATSSSGAGPTVAQLCDSASDGFRRQVEAVVRRRQRRPS